MYKIVKARETMTSKERVRRTFRFEKADRVPIGYESNPTINRKFMTALGFQDYERESFLDALGVDYRGIDVPYVGPKLFSDISGISCHPLYGFYTRWVENQFGGYSDYCNFPLKDADEEAIYAFPAPDPDDFDYSVVGDKVKRYRDYAIYVGDPGQNDIINSLGRVMGMEDALVNLQLGDEATLDYMRRKVGFEREKIYRTLEAIKKAGGEPDFVWIGEDLGTQIAPMISHELFTRVFRSGMQSCVDIAASFDIPVMIHTCGSSSWIYEDFIEMGIRAVDTLQPEAVNMSPKYLLDHFGGRLNFHGCISTAMIANESAEGVTAICKDTLQLLMPTNGYHFAPTHAIQKIRRLRTSFRCIRRRTTSVHMIEGRMQAIAAHVRYGRARQVGELVRQMLDDGFEPLDVLNHGLIAGMNEIGIKFRDNEIFVPEVLIGARAMICGMNVLRPHIIRAQMYPVGRAIIGTVRGDIHDIGKNLVKMLMESKRIEVIDLGTDVHAGEFVRAARDYQAEIVCLSALLTTTMVSIEDVVKAFQQAGTRGDVKILIGGAPVTAAFCEHAGADIYTPDAASAAEAAVHAIEEIKQQRAQ